MKKKIRVLLTKSRMDAHDRGVRVVARALRDAGIEVIYTNYALPDEIVGTAVEEDVDIMGVSSFGHGHMHVISEIMRLKKERDIEDVPVMLGGVIPDDDISALLNMGVDSVFGPGSSPEEAVKWVISQKG